MGSYAGQRRQTSCVSGWIKFALLGAIFSVLFQGAFCEEPTESQCRPYIEKALKEQHLEEKAHEEAVTDELFKEQEESPPTDELTDSTEGLITNEDEGKEDDVDDDEADVKKEDEDEGDGKEDDKTEEDNVADEQDETDEGQGTDDNEDAEREEGEDEGNALEAESKEEESAAGEQEEDADADAEDKTNEEDEEKTAAASDDEDDGDREDDSNLDTPIDIEVREVEMDNDDVDEEQAAEDGEGVEDEKEDKDDTKETEEEKTEDEVKEEDEQEKADDADADKDDDEKETDESETATASADDDAGEAEKEEESETEGDRDEGDEPATEKEEKEGDEKEDETDDDESRDKRDDDEAEEKIEKAAVKEVEAEGGEGEEEGKEGEGEEGKEGEEEGKEGEEEGKEGEEVGKEGEEGEEGEEKEDEEKEEKEAAESEAEEADKEAPEEEELIQEMVIPDNLRPRDHIDKILRLEDSGLETVLEKTIDSTLKGLKGLYDNAIKPLEMLYKYRDLSNRHFGDPEIFSKPLILFMGPWSGGKSSTINYLLDNEFSHTSLRTGAEPSPAYFNILMHGEEEEILDGTQLAADWTFSGLQKFGQSLLDRLKGVKLPNKLLEKVNIVEIPGILEIRKQVQRLFPFNDACQWFIDRADIIFLVYDPSKLDVGPETEAILDQLKGREYQTRIILNKADQVKPEELMRVQGTLIWNISPLMSSSEPPIMYSTSLWSLPYEIGAPIRLLQAQERAFLRDLREAIDKRVENKIASARRFAVRVRNHAKMVDCYLTTYYNHKTIFGNRKKISDDIIEYPQKYHIYEGLSTLTNISRYDLPDPDVYRDFFKINPLYEFKKLSETCTYFRGCPINQLDVAIAYDLPELVGKYRKSVETAKEKLQKENS